MQNKKNIAWVLIGFSLIQAGQFFLYSSTSAAENNNINLPLGEVSIQVTSNTLSRVDVLKKHSEPVILSDQQTLNCSISFQNSQLQSTAGADVFLKPASCFNLAVAKPVAEKITAIINQPENLPKVVVVHLEAFSAKKLLAPLEQEPQKTIPASVLLLALTLSTFVLLNKTEFKNSKFFHISQLNNVRFPQFEILRC